MVHVVACISTSLLFIDEYSIVYMLYILSIYSLIDGHLACLNFSAIINNAAFTIYIQVSMCKYVVSSLGYIPRRRMILSCMITMYNFLEGFLDCFPKCLYKPVSLFKVIHIYIFFK